ncbi:uncharacterized protein LOC118228208 [Anguilla anguilla]|uniref:uncharacterized protein LOC118228208 n=1 Tax=Anguilla anguilla TaxID=7936 RepID=UPI0015B03B71|nr:uncharacterized protein LOC118228208 [Anguilla anguilla]
MLAVDDKRLFCERCQLYFSDSCPAHGPPHFIKDSAVLEGVGDRAVLSLPQCLVLVERSQDPMGAVGVFSQSHLSQGSIFGPYEGEGLLSRQACTKYSWAIKDKGFFFYVDGSDESKANWMRYVACASSETEQNLTVFQYHGRIYYRVSKETPAGVELRVWIGREYGTMLGLQLGDHVRFAFGEKEALMKTFQDVQMVSVGDGGEQPASPPLAIGAVYSEVKTEDRSPSGHGTPTVSSTNPPPPVPRPDSSLAPARPALKFNFVKGSESLVSLSRAQSRYWTFFGFEANCFGQFLDKTKIICKLCGGRLAYSGNTTNLRQHLIYKHRREFNQLMDSGVAGILPGPSPAAGVIPKLAPPPAPPAGLPAPRLHRGGEGSASVSSSVTNRVSPAPPAALPAATPPPVSAAQAAAAIADFLVQDLLPPETVEGKGFRLLLSTLLPSYKLPSAQALAQELLGGAYRQGRAKWAGLLREAVRGAGPAEKSPVITLSPDEASRDSDCSADLSPLAGPAPGPKEGGARSPVALSGEVWWHGWRGGASYVTLSAHFVDEDFRQHSLTLSSRRLGEASVEARVREMAREWGVATPSFILLGGEEGNASSLYPNFPTAARRGAPAPPEQSSSLAPEHAPRPPSPPRPASSSGPSAPLRPVPCWPPVSCVLGVLRDCMQRVLQLPDVQRALSRCQALLSRLLPFATTPDPALSDPGPAPSPAPPPGVVELLADPALKAVLRWWGRDGLSWSSLYSGVQTLSDSQQALARVQQKMSASSSDPAPQQPADADPAPQQPANADPAPQQHHADADPAPQQPAAGLPEPCDWSLLRELCGVLKPLDVACSTLAREQFPRLSLVKPVLTSLLSRHFAPCPADSPFRREAKRAVRDGLAERYSDPRLSPALSLACALDPRFRGLEFLEAGERAETLRWLKEEALELAQEAQPAERDGGHKRGSKRTRAGALTRSRKRAQGRAEPGAASRGRSGPEQKEPAATIILDNDEEEDEDDGVRERKMEAQSSGPAPREQGLSDMEFLLGGLCSARPQTPQRSRAQQLERELAIFWAEPAAELGEEPLQWWRERVGQLPLLARAARVYLAAPAIAGHAPRRLAQGMEEGGAMFHKRANIPPEFLDQLLFLHHNRLSVTANQNTTA